ncbi:MAG: fasciclin domain-containing protein [Waddliaceae bacterium]
MKPLLAIVIGALVLGTVVVASQSNQTDIDQNTPNRSIEPRMERVHREVDRRADQMNRGADRVNREVDRGINQMDRGANQVRRGMDRSNDQLDRGANQVRRGMDRSNDQLDQRVDRLQRTKRSIDRNENGIRSLDRNGSETRSLNINGSETEADRTDINGSDAEMRSQELNRSRYRTLDSNKSGRDRDRRGRFDRKRSDRFFIDFGLGFNERDYYLPPRERVIVLYPIVERIPEVSVFVENVRIVEPSCIFPRDGFYTLLIPEDRYFRRIIARAGKGEVCEVLKHYIVPEPIIFDEITGEETFTTLAGDEIVIRREGRDYYIGDVRISKPAAYQEKGLVIHVIDGDIR